MSQSGLFLKAIEEWNGGAPGRGEGRRSSDVEYAVVVMPFEEWTALEQLRHVRGAKLVGTWSHGDGPLVVSEREG